MKKSFHEFNLQKVREELSALGHLRPRVQLILNTGHLLYFGYSGEETELAKARQAIIMAIMAARISGRFLCASFASEAWISVRDPKDPMLKLRACEDPERKEGLFCISWEGQAKVARFFELQRDPAGKPIIGQEGPPYEGILSWIEEAFRLPLLSPMPNPVKKMAEDFLDGMVLGKRKI